jgi:hypothetical protein
LSNKKRLENSTSERSGSLSGNAVHERRGASESGAESISKDTERRDGSAITDDKSASVDGNKLANTPGRRFEQCEPCGETQNDISEESQGKGVADTDISQSRWKNVKKPGETALTGLGSDSRSSGKLAESDESGTCGWGEDRTLPKDRGVEIQPNRLRKTTKADVSRNGNSRGYEEKLVDSEAEGFQGCGESHSEERGKHQGERREVVGGSTKSGTYGSSSGGEDTSSETQSELGRAIDGVADRVDRLRLLGNGVVPQVAEKAFRVLLEETQKKDNEDLMDNWFE